MISFILNLLSQTREYIFGKYDGQRLILLTYKMLDVSTGKPLRPGETALRTVTAFATPGLPL